MQPQIGQRIAGVEQEAGLALVEAEQIERVVEALETDCQRHVEEPRLGIADAEVFEQEADLGAERRRLAAPEEVGVLQQEGAEQRGGAVVAAADLEGGGVTLLNVNIEVDLVRLA